MCLLHSVGVFDSCLSLRNHFSLQGFVRRWRCIETWTEKVEEANITKSPVYRFCLTAICVTLLAFM